jgi:hypothetical protein
MAPRRRNDPDDSYNKARKGLWRAVRSLTSKKLRGISFLTLVKEANSEIGQSAVVKPHRSRAFE